MLLREIFHSILCNERTLTICTLAEAYIYKALWLMENELFSSTRNHGDRQEAINLALIITDSQYPVMYPGTRQAVQRVAQQTRDKDIGMLEFY